MVHSGDRNLLFGIIALQMDFISRDDLIAALNAWSLQKQKTLGELLEERGALAHADRALLEPLVRRHIQQHGDDPSLSLASLRSVDWIRPALAPLGRMDPEIQQTVDRLAPQSSATIGGADETTTFSDSASPGGPRFRILRFHARGGLGEVFVAEDAELHREVALKQIQDQYSAHPASRSRFILEAEITGGLEHPGIVPVYGLGTDDAGRPFYAMRFIKGDSLREAIERFHRGEAAGRRSGERMLDLQKLLRRFLDVCNAMAYAHSRGVLHRDIKPGNIMVGQYGETLVVDWGLAKVVGVSESSSELTLRPPSASGSSETLPGLAIGTPAFMSPEQAGGRLEELGPASDVYSLGATLYCLLTGRPPIEGSNVEEVIRLVQLGQFQSSRQVKQDVPLPLDAICSKAMALDPLRRYATPRALADDIERWLADESVSAYAEPWAGRAARWARRHQTTVVAAGATIAVAAVCLGTATILLAAANERERKLAELARGNGDQARHNFQLAFDAVDRFLTQVSEDRLKNAPGLQPVRRELLSTARDFYRQFLDDRRDDPMVRAELGRSCFRLATIEFETEATSKAVDLARQGLAIIEPLAHANRSSIDYEKELAQGKDALGNMLALLRKPELSEPELRESIRLWRDLVSRRPDDLSLVKGLASAQCDLASLFSEAERTADAQTLLEEARETARALAAVRPDDLDFGLTRHRIDYGLCQHFKSRGAMAAALASIAHALDAIAGPTRNAPNDLSLQYLRAGSLILRAEIEREMNRLEAAEISFRDAIAVLDRLVRQNPMVILYRRALFRAHFGWASVCMSTGQWDRAGEHHQASLKLAEELAQEHPDIPDVQNELAVALSGIAEAAYWTGSMDQHAAASNKALEIRRKLARNHPTISHFQGVLELSRNAVSFQSGHVGRAPARTDPTTLEGLRKLARDHPEIVKYRTQLGHELNTLGGRLQTAMQMEQSASAYQESVDVWRELVRIEPDVPEVRFLLARSLSNLGGLFVTRKEFDRAVGVLDEGNSLLESVTREYPRINRYSVAIAGNVDTMASIAGETGDSKRAKEGYERAIHILDDVLSRDPKNNQAKQFRQTTRRNHALVTLRTGDHEGATRELDALGAEPLRPEEVYNLACTVSLASALARGLDKLAKTDREALSDRLAVRAVGMLAKAAADGFPDQAAMFAQFRSDTDLDPIRTRADFRELITRIGAQGAAKVHPEQGASRGPTNRPK